MRRKDTERSHCYALVDWASLHPICSIYFYHIENERKCSPAQGWIRKRMGVKKGVADYFLSYPAKGYHGFYIELKLPGRYLSVEQSIFIANARLAGFKADVYYDWHDAKLAIEEYLA